MWAVRGGRAFNSRGSRGSPALWACLWLDHAYEVTHGSDFTALRWETLLFRPPGGRRRGERFGVFRHKPQGSRRAGLDTGGALSAVFAPAQLALPARGWAGGDRGRALSLRPRAGLEGSSRRSRVPMHTPGPRLSLPHLDGCEGCPTASRLPR